MGTGVGQRGRIAQHVGNPDLRRARQQRGWTEDDVAVRLHELAGELGEPTPGVSGPQVGKWERGVRSPGRYYRPRLCLVFEAMPREIGLVPNPRLMHDIGQLGRKRVELQPRQQDQRAGPTASGTEHSAPVVNISHNPGPKLPESAFPQMDRDRLAVALRYLWPADEPLVGGLGRAVRQLSHRTDTESPDVVLPDLRAFLEGLQQLLSRSQPPELASRLMVLASVAAMHTGFLHDIGGRWSDAYTHFAVSESLARESGSGTQLAMVLINKSEVYSRRARGPEDLGPAVTFTEAAQLAVEPNSPAGLRAWIVGERAAHEAEFGDDLASGQDVELAYRIAAGASATELNLFSDLDSRWLEHYRAIRALRLGQPDEAIAVYSLVLRQTDPQLLWERARALYRLAAAWALKGEVERACDLLMQAAALTAMNGDRRGLLQVQRVRDRELGRWGSDHHLRALDEAIRLAGGKVAARRAQPLP
jgi:transcriptional regulator with XRE-family HTH domain/tetratricopeptide (TPR) repeat protein